MEACLLTQNLPKGVINIVNGFDLSDKRICHNPLLLKSLLKSLASVNWTRIVSTLGMG